MTDQEREADIRKLMSDWYTSPKSNETPVVLLRLLDAERERVKKLLDAARHASSVVYSARNHIGFGEYDIARERAMDAYVMLQAAALIAEDTDEGDAAKAALTTEEHASQ